MIKNDLCALLFSFSGIKLFEISKLNFKFQMKFGLTSDRTAPCYNDDFYGCPLLAN